MYSGLAGSINVHNVSMSAVSGNSRMRSDHGLRSVGLGHVIVTGPGLLVDFPDGLEYTLGC
jgi:hypothetical protein